MPLFKVGSYLILLSFLRPFDSLKDYITLNFAAKLQKIPLLLLILKINYYFCNELRINSERMGLFYR